MTLHTFWSSLLYKFDFTVATIHTYVRLNIYKSLHSKHNLFDSSMNESQ